MKTDTDGSRSILTCVKPIILQVADQNNKALRNKKRFDLIIERSTIQMRQRI